MSNVETQSGGLVTGLKVAIASKLLENHPNLKTGAIAGLVVSEAERALFTSTRMVTSAIQETSANQEEAQLARHQQLIGNFQQIAESAESLQKLSDGVRLAAELDEALKLVAATHPRFQESLEVISDAELYELLRQLQSFHRSDFGRANPGNPQDLWKYRAAMTLSLGLNHDYGIDNLDRADIGVLFDSDLHFRPPQPKTTILNLLRRQYLKLLANHAKP